jgi:hypothetical protein
VEFKCQELEQIKKSKEQEKLRVEKYAEKLKDNYEN